MTPLYYSQVDAIRLQKADGQMVMGQKPVPPANIRIPTKIGSNISSAHLPQNGIPRQPNRHAVARGKKNKKHTHTHTPRSRTPRSRGRRCPWSCCQASAPRNRSETSAALKWRGRSLFCGFPGKEKRHTQRKGFHVFGGGSSFLVGELETLKNGGPFFLRFSSRKMKKHPTIGLPFSGSP